MGEGGVWLDEEGGVWLDAEDACDVKLSILPPHEQRQEQGKPVLLYAPSHLLCSIPFFATCLSEPWQAKQTPDDISAQPSQRDISLECADPSSPADYCKCLLFLKPQEPVNMSVDSAIRLLRAADHLLFQECADLCMSFLASTPWSDKEEEAIHQAVSVMGLKPSSDLTIKLSSSEDVQVFKEVLRGMAEKAGSGENHVAAVRDLVHATFLDAPRPVTLICASVLREAWASATNDLIIGLQRCGSWNTLTLLLLEYGDTEKLLEDFVAVSKKLCPAMMRLFDQTSLIEALSQLFLRAVPGKQNSKFVILSNAHRATLVAAWAPMVARLHCKSLENTFKQLFSTLPLQDPVVIALVKQEAGNAYFQACYGWWRSKLFKRMKRCDLVHEEIDLEAPATSSKRVRLTIAD